MAIVWLYLQRFNVQIVLASIAAVICSYLTFIPTSVVDLAVEFVIRIHQIPIIPYIVLSLIVGIGSLDKDKFLEYAYKLLIYTLLMWLVSTILLFSIGMMHVPLAHQVDVRHVISHLNLHDIVGMGYVSNLTSIFGGVFIPVLCVVVLVSSVSLIFIPDRDVIIRPLNVVRQMFEFFFEWLLKLLPLSLFILLLHALGVFDLKQISLLSAHMIATITFSAFVIVIFFPMLLKFLRGVPYRQSLMAALPCIWLTFLAGDCVVALPLIVRTVRKLLHDMHIKYDERVVGVLVPISFSLPLAGSLGNLLFIHLATSLYGIQIDYLMNVQLTFIGILTMFAEPLISIPLLLEYFQVPHDSVPLFMLVTTVTDLFFDACETFSMISLVFLVLSPAQVSQSFIRKTCNFLIILLIMFFIVTPIVYVVRLLPQKDTTWAQNTSIHEITMNHSHIKSGDVIGRIKKTHTLIVGIAGFTAPYCTRDGNKIGGYEVDLVQRLASDLKVAVKFVNVDSAINPLHENMIDIMICRGVLKHGDFSKHALTQPIVEGKYAELRSNHVNGKQYTTGLVNYIPDGYVDVALNTLNEVASKRLIVPESSMYYTKNVLPQYTFYKKLDSGYILTWAVEPSAGVWLNFINQWLTAIKIDPSFLSLQKKWFYP